MLAAIGMPRRMAERSHGHHEVPQWLLKHFCRSDDEKLWIGFKDTRRVSLVSVVKAFRRNDANTRTDYHRQKDGTFELLKSDQDEKLLADFDSRASSAVHDLINAARRQRDAGVDALSISPESVETCKQTIVVQARRTRESQDRVGFGNDHSELYLSLFSKRAEELGHRLPPRDDLLSDARVVKLIDELSQNLRATFASGNHQILADNEEAFLAPLGLHVAVIDPATAEFVVGSHGITIVETTRGRNTWLPISPDVAISFSDRPGEISIGIYGDEFVEHHNRAALATSERVAGRSKQTIREVLASLD